MEGLDDAIARARAFAEAGADVLFVEAPTSRGRHRAGGEGAGRRRPAGLQLGRGRQDAAAVADRIAELGFALVIFPIGTLLAATAGIRALLATLRPRARRSSALHALPAFGEFTDLIGLPEIQELEQRFSG